MPTERSFDWDLEASDLLKVLRDGVIVADAAENLIVGWNPAAEQIFGYSSEEAIGMAVSSLMPERMRERHEAGLARYAATGEGHFVDNHDPLELPGLTKSGVEIAVEFQLTPLRQSHDGRLYAVAIVRDVTERNEEAEARRKLEEAAAASQRLEAVGQLATGVAHDFNNLLTVILGQIYFVKDAPQLDAEKRESLEAVVAAAERGASLSRQLLTFSRKSIVTRSAVSLNDALTSAAKFLGRTLGADIALNLELSPSLPRTMMDAAQVDQVLANLALNARDAMPDGGSLTICTDLKSLLAVDQGEVPPGVYVSLTVTDTGIGMDEEVRRRVFEPFFTTKPRERGTGMGLAMVYGIVAQAGGFVRCESTLGEGTTFEILLPAAALIPDMGESPELPTAIAITGGARILLVDDDPAILSAVVRILERAGHVVTHKNDAVAALEVANQSSDSFDLLISDVVMPRMNGLDLARELTSNQKVGRVLLMSGYPEGAVSAGELQNDGFSFLPKPFTPDTLLQRVAESLDGGTSG